MLILYYYTALYVGNYGNHATNGEKVIMVQNKMTIEMQMLLDKRDLKLLVIVSSSFY
jgi:hypothetical protein